VCAQCFYHLEVYDDALKFALGAGAYFDVNARGEYIDTMIGARSA
jgi:26S proteasome regulatory subunit N2